MRKRIYLLALSCAFIIHVTGQDCSTLQLSCVSSPSRCMATGAINITATGGSGNYNYLVSGPITTPYTSSSNITGLPAGSYSVSVKDIVSGCIAEQPEIIVDGSYSTPSFLLSKTDVSCHGNDGTITVNDLQNGRAPFTFSIVAPSASAIGTTNSTGYFQNLIAGEYSIQLQDSCGGIQVRRITVENFNWFFNGISVTKAGCDSADISILLNDNNGGNNESNPVPFAGFSYGIIKAPGDTLWFSSHAFRIALSGGTVTAVIKDPCGNLVTAPGSVPAGTLPAAGPVVTGNFTCNTFTATVTGQQNLTNPQYCLYDAANTLVGCNTTGIFNNLPYGAYCIRIDDACYDTIIVRCFTGSHPVPSADDAVAISNQNCSTFTATITGQTNLTNPEYCLYTSADVLIGCNNNGIFSLVPYGSYCITVRDNCYDTTIRKCFTASPPLPVITGVNVIAGVCNSFDVDIIGNADAGTRFCLYDNNGNVITCNNTGIFENIVHGNYCIRAVSSCGDTTAPFCFATQMPIPVLGQTVSITNKTCNTFTASVSGQTNMTNPVYCLFDANNVQVQCNTTGVFNLIPYGSYCINVTDGCYDTTIQRCFTAIAPVVSVNATIQQTNKTCTSFTATITGTNLTSPQFCLRDSTGALVGCNNTGVFNNLPYNKYCAEVTDGCLDTTFTVCQSFLKARGVTMGTYKTCTIGYAVVSAQMKSVNNPFTFTFYHPDGTVLYTTTTWSGYVSRELPALPAGAQYKVVGVDNCGDRDSGYIAPDATMVTRNVTVSSKCPGSIWPDGSGDLTVVCTSNLFNVKPLLVSKDGTSINQSYSNTNGWNTFSFTNLGPATYVIRYTMDQCNTSVYDTVVLRPYQYPTNNQSAVYQCDNNGFTLNGNVVGGIGPFNYEIIGSTPSSPSIISPPQTSPFFDINNGTAYSLIRLRTVDACGNASLSDVGVLPLQNIIITANSTCLYTNVTLSVDTIPNATYQWYKKTGLNDSVLVSTNVAYNIPFMTETDRAEYVCVVRVNGNCLTRITSFSLNGSCGGEVLSSGPLLLTGKPMGGENLLEWTAIDHIAKYVIERSTTQSGSFRTVGEIEVSGTANREKYQFTDKTPAAGSNIYRIKAVDRSGAAKYSNSIVIRNNSFLVSAYPNPASNALNVLIKGRTPSDYHVELVSVTGQVVYRKDVHHSTSITLPVSRNSLMSGIYLVKVSNAGTGETEIFKVQFE